MIIGIIIMTKSSTLLYHIVAVVTVDIIAIVKTGSDESGHRSLLRQNHRSDHVNDRYHHLQIVYSNMFIIYSNIFIIFPFLNLIYFTKSGSLGPGIRRSSGCGARNPCLPLSLSQASKQIDPL